MKACPREPKSRALTRTWNLRQMVRRDAFGMKSGREVCSHLGFCVVGGSVVHAADTVSRRKSAESPRRDTVLFLKSEHDGPER